LRIIEKKNAQKKSYSVPAYPTTVQYKIYDIVYNDVYVL